MSTSSVMSGSLSGWAVVWWRCTVPGAGLAESESADQDNKHPLWSRGFESSPPIAQYFRNIPS